MSSQMELFAPHSPTSVQEDFLGIKGLQYRAGILNSDEQSRILGEIDHQPWRSDLKRRVQHYGYRYDYKARRVDRSMYLGVLPSFAIEVAQKLLDNSVITKMPDQAIVNEYKPGQGISAHVDCEPCFSDTISTVSFGWAYEMNFIRVGRANEVQSVLLEPGSVLVMRGDARYRWLHEIKARKSDRGIARKRRVSLTFRNVIVDECSTDERNKPVGTTLNTGSPIDWLCERSSGFASLPQRERDAIAHFALLWSYFEAEVLPDGANATAIETLSRGWEANRLITTESFGDCLSYFKARYVQDGEVTHRFAGLHLRQNDNEPLVEAVLKGERQDAGATAAALLIIVYRFRNNLFHGKKWGEELEGQYDNFTNANTILMRAVELGRT